jgi:DNA-binding NarL/FixJ family response regulator
VDPSAQPVYVPLSEQRPIRILVVDDHPLLRDGIAALIDGQPDMELVGEAANGREGIEQFRKHAPDVTLMDLQMPETTGVEAITAIRENAPGARIIVLTTYSGDIQVLHALKAGARAYLLKNLLHKDLLETIRAVNAGRKTMSPSLAAEIAEHSGEEILTAREIDVLRLIAGGHANKEIAARLWITEETVKSRVKNILSKLHANDRAHAAVIGVKRGIIIL